MRWSETKRVKLIQIDGKYPNCALMKLSTHHKDQGHIVGFNVSNPDLVYISCIFSWNKAKALGISKMFTSSTVITGGTGLNFDCLPDSIEHLMPDYDLYNIDYSMGFTSRGCFRDCPWCIVPQKEGPMRDHAPLSEFLDPGHDKLVLYDNNFLGSPKWKENLNHIIEQGLKVNFNQGLDIRLVNEESVELLSQCKVYDYDFKARRYHFAFDLPSIEKEMLRGISLLLDAGLKPWQLMFYILVGFNTSYLEDLHRIQLLKELKVLPYVMSFNNRKDSYYPHLARWVNRRYYKFVEWDDYDHGSSQKIIRRMGPGVPDLQLTP